MHVVPDILEYIPINSSSACLQIIGTLVCNININTKKSLTTLFRGHNRNVLGHLEDGRGSVLGHTRQRFCLKYCSIIWRGGVWNSICHLINMGSDIVFQTAVLSDFQHHLAVNSRHVTLQFNLQPLWIKCYPPLSNHLCIYFDPSIFAYWHQPITSYQHLPPEQPPRPYFTQSSSSVVPFQLVSFCPAFNFLSLRPIGYPPPTEKPISHGWERKKRQFGFEAFKWIPFLKT